MVKPPQPPLLVLELGPVIAEADSTARLEGKIPILDQKLRIGSFHVFITSPNDNRPHNLTLTLGAVEAEPLEILLNPDRDFLVRREGIGHKNDHDDDGFPVFPIDPASEKVQEATAIKPAIEASSQYVRVRLELDGYKKDDIVAAVVGLRYDVIK